jgi:hypothetical protein
MSTAGDEIVAPTRARPNRESRFWAIGAHLSALAGGFLGGVPAFLGPLVVWLARRQVDPFASLHGQAALNFNLSVLLYYAVLILFTILTFGLGSLVAISLGFLIWLGWLVCSILGAIKAAADQEYRYPLTIRFVR